MAQIKLALNLIIKENIKTQVLLAAKAITNSNSNMSNQSLKLKKYKLNNFL
jgi:hypothetical protein